MISSGIGIARGIGATPPAQGAARQGTVDGENAGPVDGTGLPADEAAAAEAAALETAALAAQGDDRVVRVGDIAQGAGLPAIARPAAGDAAGLFQDLFYAVQFPRNTELVRRLIEAGADVNLGNQYVGGRTALMEAARRGHVETVQVLINAGARVDSRDNFGRTAMMLAAARGQTKTIQILIDAGADVGLKDNGGTAALMWAAANGQVETVQMLINIGTDDVNDLRDNNGTTLLIAAANNGQTETVGTLIKAGADVDLQDTAGQTALMWAARNGKTETVEALIAAGADVDLQNKYGGTALMAAVRLHYTTGPAQALIKARAKPNLKTNDGRTALDLVDEKDQPDMARILKRVDAKRSQAR